MGTFVCKLQTTKSPISAIECQRFGAPPPLLNVQHAVLADARRRRDVVVGEWRELVGTLVAEHLAAVAAVVLPQAVGELVAAGLTVSDIKVGHPLRRLVVGLVDLVPAAAAHGVVAEREAVVRVALVSVG